MFIRRLEKDDISTFRTLRLASLKDAPTILVRHGRTGSPDLMQNCRGLLRMKLSLRLSLTVLLSD